MTDCEAAAFVRFLKKHGCRVRFFDNTVNEIKRPACPWSFATVSGYGVEGLIERIGSNFGSLFYATAEGTMDKWRRVPLIMRLPLRGPRKNELLAWLRWLGQPENRHISVPGYSKAEDRPGFVPREIG